MNRKDFIVAGGRIFFLALMVCFIGFLAGKRRVSLGGYCEDNAGCSGCRLNTICKDGEQRV